MPNETPIRGLTSRSLLRSGRPGSALIELAGCDMIAAEVEHVIDLIMSREEPVHLAGYLEALHLPLSPAGRLVRIFCPVVQSFMSAMLDGGHHLTLCGTVALLAYPPGQPSGAAWLANLMVFSSVLWPRLL